MMDSRQEVTGLLAEVKAGRKDALDRMDSQDDHRRRHPAGVARRVHRDNRVAEAKPSVKNKLLQWNDVPPLSENYEASRAAIVQWVEKLVESLAANRK